MRILEAFGEPVSFGGEENFAVSMLAAMELKGATVDFLTPYYCENPQITELVESLGGNVHVLNLPFAPGKTRKDADAPIRDFLQKEKYDVIHIHSGSTSMLAIYAEAAKASCVEKIIVHAHCAGIPNIKHTIAKTFTASALCRYPDVYLACSKAAADWMFPAKVSRSAQVVRNGIESRRFALDEEVRADRRASLGIRDEKVIGFVGRLCKEKNPAFVLDIVKSLGEGYRALYIGDGECRGELEEEAKKLGIRADFTGAVSNVEDYYQAMDCLVLPSSYEGFSLVTVEAQTSGLPVIVTEAVSKDAAVTELVKFMPCLDAGAWAKTIAAALNKKRRDRTSEIIDGGLDIETVAERIGKIYFE